MSDAKKRVQKGIWWLDENHPGWVDKVDLFGFNFNYTDKCVLGKLNIFQETRDKIGKELMFEYGFDVCTNEYIDTHILAKDLNEEWKLQIGLLQNKSVEPVKCITLSLTYEELSNRFPEKMKTVLEAMTFQVNQKQAEEWGISSYEFNARIK